MEKCVFIEWNESNRSAIKAFFSTLRTFKGCKQYAPDPND